MLLTWHYNLFPVTLVISLYSSSHTFFWLSTNFFIYVDLLWFNLTNHLWLFPSALTPCSGTTEKQFLPPCLSLVQVKSEFGAGELDYIEVCVQMPREHNTFNLISLPTMKRKLFFIPTSAQYTIKNLVNIPMVQTAEGENVFWWLSWDNFIIWICILNTCMIIWMVLKESGVYDSVLPLMKLVPSCTLEMR